jgi:hypothetical protein
MEFEQTCCRVVRFIKSQELFVTVFEIVTNALTRE